MAQVSVFLGRELRKTRGARTLRAASRLCATLESVHLFALSLKSANESGPIPIFTSVVNLVLEHPKISRMFRYLIYARNSEQTET
jgi:hypothetical protein